MQRRHRRRHLRNWIVIGVIVGIGFVAGLALKQERPIETQTFGAVPTMTGEIAA